MPTVSELIHSSFRLIGAIAAGETLETHELNDAFTSLNQMLALWGTEGASIAGRYLLEVAVGTPTNSYPLTFQPIHIESASVRYGGYLNSPVRIVDSTGYEAVPEKEARTVYNHVLYCDYQFPRSTLYLAPIPRVGGVLEMWIYAELPQFTDLGQSVSLPFGYEQALRYNFAVAILPEYPRSQVDPTLLAQAQNYKASIVQLNASNHMRSQMSSPAQSAIADAAQTAAR